MMRTVKTFILRLIVDSEAPERLCGDLAPSLDRKTFSFKNEEALSDLLHTFMDNTSRGAASPACKPAPGGEGSALPD